MIGSRYSARIQLGLTTKLKVPAFLFEEYGLAKLKGYEVVEYPYSGLYDRTNSLYDYDDYYYPQQYDQIQKRITRSVLHSNATQKERMYLYKHVEKTFEKWVHYWLIIESEVACRANASHAATVSKLEHRLTNLFMNYWLSSSHSWLMNKVIDWLMKYLIFCSSRTT